DNPRLQFFFDRFWLRACRRARYLFGRLVVRHEGGEWVKAFFAFIKDELPGELTALLINFEERKNLFRVHDGGIQARLDRVMKKYRVQHLSDLRRQTKRDIGYAQHRKNTRQVLFDQPDRLDRLDSRFAKLLIARTQGEGQSIKHQILRPEAKVLNRQ